jgi:membrane protein implicated in regulation of membrane protease activity
MFLIFAAAVLIVTGAVALVALVGAWSMLGVAFAIHVIMTTVVVLTILYVMDGRVHASAECDRPSLERGRRVEASPQSHIEPATVP